MELCLAVATYSKKEVADTAVGPLEHHENQVNTENYYITNSRIDLKLANASYSFPKRDLSQVSWC